MAHLLAVDIGNSTITVGLFGEAELAGRWSLRTVPEAGAEELALTFASLCPGTLVDGAVMACVVPPLVGPVEEAIRSAFGVDALIVSSACDLGLAICADEPGLVGADRLCDAVAAAAFYGVPAVVLNLGTATTVTVVNAEGEIVGGAIAIGAASSLEYLAARTHQLPRVRIGKVRSVVGGNTGDAIRAGAYYGFAGLAEGLVGRAKAEMGGGAAVVATGGLAALLGPEVPSVDRIDADLTLQGLRLIYQRTAIPAADAPSS